MDWTDETIDRLRALWEEGHSTAEIGRRLGITKNAVVGKAHRLKLLARPSPIRRSASEAEPSRRSAARRVDGPTLPALATSVQAPRPVITPRLPAVMRVVTATRPFGRTSACCWPVGEPGTASFHFCGESAANGKPYCAKHVAIAYVKVRDRREDAA